MISMKRRTRERERKKAIFYRSKKILSSSSMIRQDAFENNIEDFFSYRYSTIHV